MKSLFRDTGNIGQVKMIHALESGKRVDAAWLARFQTNNFYVLRTMLPLLDRGLLWLDAD